MLFNFFIYHRHNVHSMFTYLGSLEWNKGTVLRKVHRSGDMNVYRFPSNQDKNCMYPRNFPKHQKKLIHKL